ncbi:hypothetical protein EV424DRAFT_1534788 [Suillus variegatus]|nr:hypothetical protein EV424DRAFT_1534788 [Suillus variegatus]
MKSVDLYDPFQKKRRMRSSAIAQHNLHVSSEDVVHSILEPGREERTYYNPFMVCSSMGEYLDVLSAHDGLQDGKRLKMNFEPADDDRSLDLGFPLSDYDQMTDNHDQQQSDMLDMQFPTLSDDDRSNGEMLDLGFPPQPDDEDVLDLGFDIDLYGALDMGFGTYLADDSLDKGTNISPEEHPLDMGFEMDLVRVDPDQSFAISRQDPVGYVIQRAVGDLREAMHRLQIDWAGNAMSPDEAFAREQVLDCTQELLLACQLMSISRLST